MRRHPAPTPAAAALLVALAASPSLAQHGGAPARAPAAATSALRGAYSEAQAARGEAIYRATCASCHTPAAHSGEAFERAWSARSAFELFELVRTTMPYDNPGRLGRQQYADIVAYLLKLNGLPPGAEPLPTGEEGLRRVRIEVTPRPRPSPATHD